MQVFEKEKNKIKNICFAGGGFVLMILFLAFFLSACKNTLPEPSPNAQRPSPKAIPSPVRDEKSAFLDEMSSLPPCYIKWGNDVTHLLCDKPCAPLSDEEINEEWKKLCDF